MPLVSMRENAERIRITLVAKPLNGNTGSNGPISKPFEQNSKIVVLFVGLSSMKHLSSIIAIELAKFAVCSVEAAILL